MPNQISHPLMTRVSRMEHRKHLLYGLAFLFVVWALFSSSALAEVITSQAAVVIDASTGEILYGKNFDYLLPPASTTKLMTAIIVMEKANLSDVVTISQKASQVRPFKAGFKKGDRVTIEGLLYAALLKSGNDAAFALAEAVAGSEEDFVSLMNQKALSLGAENTRFINATGLPGSGQSITALDLSRIMKHALRYPKLREILATPSAKVMTERGKVIFLRNTDELLWTNEEVIGGKTGYTHSAKHCFVLAAERDRKTVIVSLLGSPSRKSLWREAKTLTHRGLQMIAHDPDPGDKSASLTIGIPVSIVHHLPLPPILF
ncbi:MAG: D-alanyl-D-alanine carboxypeptidase family protein [Thermodesulfobacteriota bacterium]